MGNPIVPPKISQAVGQAFRLGRAVRLVWQCAPGWAILNMVLVILQGLLPLATLYLIKRIIDAVTAAKGAIASSLGLSSVPCNRFFAAWPAYTRPISSSSISSASFP